MSTRRRSTAGRLLALLVVAALSLQLYFLLRVALMTIVDPQSTTFQRSEAWRLALAPRSSSWQQRWVDYGAISVNLKRAVVASEDAGFTEHSGVEWDALEKAWERNQRAEAAVGRVNERLARQEPTNGRPGPAPRAAKVVGGSTISQQLAKNVFLGSERSLLRKAQELVLTWEMEALLGKRRILEIYLNSVEWGEGVFGAEAAARRYFHEDASTLSTTQAAQLAVMLPAPKRFEKRLGSPYVVSRSSTIAARMGAVELP
jgi:monofunctional biosynthetic peptidoglycan transglycosylase